MPIVSIFWGIVLIGLGVGFWQETGAKTALIPAYLGGPLAVCGLVALKESLLKHAMHLAAMIGLVGTLGGIANLIRGALSATGTFYSVLETALMTGLCFVFVLLCVNSFVQARRRRAAREVQAAP